MLSYLFHAGVTLILLLGAFVCLQGIGTKNPLYKGGLIFFVLLLCSNAYTWFFRLFAGRIIENMLSNQSSTTVGYLLYLANLPVPIIESVAFLILIISLYKNFNHEQRYNR